MFGKISKISIANFLSAETRLVQKYPFKFGSSSSSDWVLGASSTPWSKSSVSFYKEGPKVVLKVDTGGMEKKFDKMTESKSVKNDISSSVNKLKSMKGK